MSASLHLVAPAGDETPVDLIEEFLAFCEQRNLRPGTIYNRNLTLRRLQATLGPLEKVTEQALIDWYRELGRRVIPETRAVELSNVQNFYRWMIRERHRADDPTVRLIRPRLQRRLPRPIPEADLLRAFDAATPEVRVMLHLAAYSGFRACEIAGLRGQDIDYSGKTLLVVDGKGGRQRVVPLHSEVERMLLAANIPTRGPLFFKGDWRGLSAGRLTTEQASPHNVSHRCNRHLFACRSGATLHQLRHYFGTEMYRHSQDLRLVQETLGHASPTTTALYAQFDQTKAAPAVNAIGRRD